MRPYVASLRVNHEDGLEALCERVQLWPMPHSRKDIHIYVPTSYPVPE
jgi:hypothetical protein